MKLCYKEIRTKRTFFDFVEKYEDQIRYLEQGYPNTKLPPKKGIRHLRREYDKSKIGEAAAKTSTTSDSFRLVENTIGLATTLSCKCKTDDEKNFDLHVPEKVAKANTDSRYESAQCFGINYRFVCGMHLLGGGAVKSAKLLGMMDLPWQGWEKEVQAS